MRTTRASWMALTLLILLAPACAVVSRQQHDTIEREVGEVENMRVQALVGGDLAQLERLLSDDLTYTHSDGRVQTKAELLAALRSGAIKYEAMRHADVRVGVYGETAVLTGRSQLAVNANGQRVSFPVRFTLVYVKRRGEWKMVAWQSTRLPAQ